MEELAFYFPSTRGSANVNQCDPTSHLPEWLHKKAHIKKEKKRQTLSSFIRDVEQMELLHFCFEYKMLQPLWKSFATEKTTKSLTPNTNTLDSTEHSITHRLRNASWRICGIEHWRASGDVQLRAAT